MPSGNAAGGGSCPSNDALKQGLFAFASSFMLSFALSLSKGRSFLVRQSHHERTTLVALENEDTLRPVGATADIRQRHL